MRNKIIVAAVLASTFLAVGYLLPSQEEQACVNYAKRYSEIMFGFENPGIYAGCIESLKVRREYAKAAGRLGDYKMSVACMGKADSIGSIVGCMGW